jgi:hypothetical protein
VIPNTFHQSIDVGLGVGEDGVIPTGITDTRSLFADPCIWPGLVRLGPCQLTEQMGTPIEQEHEDGGTDGNKGPPLTFKARHLGSVPRACDGSYNVM